VVETAVVPRFSLIDDVYEAILRRQEEAAVAEKGGDGASAATVQAAEGEAAAEFVGRSEAESAEEAAEVEVLSEMEQWTRGLIADEDNLDVVRKTSYAFIEAGAPPSQSRAVWIRDGPTGKIRAPSDEERAHLLGGRARELKSRRKV
jgi:hypothetical protein